MRKHPDWLKVRLPAGPEWSQTRRLLRAANLHTVCEEAKCPNIAECFSKRTATFMILGDVCTRNCLYCGVKKGKPKPVDESEPNKVAAAVKKLGLRYAVVTSVTRDDLPDGGAGVFADTVTAVKDGNPDCLVEVLIPDFSGSSAALRKVIDAAPHVINHNIEVVRGLFSDIRPEGDYDRSLRLLRSVKGNSRIMTKSGFMIGIGETGTDIHGTMRDLRGANCDILTIGQYLQPSRENISVAKYYEPAEFGMLKKDALKMGFLHAETGPLVRSSYHAGNAETFIR
ncbi:MAG: lipoyl synthase [archaeon]